MAQFFHSADSTPHGQRTRNDDRGRSRKMVTITHEDIAATFSSLNSERTDLRALMFNVRLSHVGTRSHILCRRRFPCELECLSRSTETHGRRTVVPPQRARNACLIPFMGTQTRESNVNDRRSACTYVEALRGTSRRDVAFGSLLNAPV